MAGLFFWTDFDGNVYVVGEWYMAGKDIDYHAQHIKELARKLNWHTDGKGRLTALIDSAADQHTLASRKSVSELFYDRGILVNTNVEKQLFSGIASVKSYFAEGKIKIFSTCVNLIRELKSYWWGSGDRPIKKDDHALDALRYYIVSKPQPAKVPKTQISEIQKDKNKLISARKNAGKRIR